MFCVLFGFTLVAAREKYEHINTRIHFYDVPEEISRFLVVQMTKVIELPLPLSPPTPWPFIAGYEAKNVCQTKRRKKKIMRNKSHLMRRPRTNLYII